MAHPLSFTGRISSVKKITITRGIPFLSRGTPIPAFLVAALLFLGHNHPGPPLFAQELPPPALAPAPGAWAGAVDQARELILDRMEEQTIPGLSVAVGVSGEIVWAEGFGWADLENRVSVWPATKFRIASISKSLTAGAVGRLLEEGKLDLDAPVQEYVPSFPCKEWPVTTRLLGGHLGGIRHYRDREFESMVHYENVVDGLAIFAEDPLIHEPGTAYAYSTYGWNLISAVVQGAAGEPFLDYMRKVVFEPNGMSETVAEHVDSLIYHRSRAYLRNPDGRLVNAPYVDNSNKWSGGGFLSTASDLVRYGLAFLGGDFLDPQTIEVLWTSQHTRDGERTGYGIGWRESHEDGRRVIYHTGGAVGGTTVLVIYPEEGVVVAILTNIQGASQTGNAREIASLFMEEGR
ncbi:MAG: serine hydrolase domain-containing protein [Longimicrobiales bacterium]